MRKNSGDEETLPDEQQGRRERFSSEDNPFDMEPSVVGKPRIDPVPRGSVEEASAGRRGSTPSGRRERNILLHGGGEEGGKSKLTSTLLMVVVFATLTGLLMGYDLCVIAVILEPVKKDFRLCGTAFTCFDKEMVVSLIAPGAVVGSFAGGCMTDKLGRRISIALSDVFIMLGCFLMAAAPVESLFTLLLGRIFIGVGVGIGFAVVAPYISEVSPTDRRGQLVLGIEISQCCGCLLAYGIATVISPTHGQWRSLMAAAGFVALVQGGGVFLLPESPRWLVAKGRTVEARAVILKVGLATDATADKQLKAMEKEMNVFNKRTMEPIPQEEEEAAAIEAEGGNSESDSSDSEEKEKDGETGRSPERQARRKQRQGDGSPVEERRESGETDRSGSGGGVQHREDSRDSFEDEALTDDEPVEAEGGVGGRENTGEEKGGRGRQRGKKKGETSPNGGGGVGAPVVPYPSPSSDDGKERKKHPRTELPVTRLAHAVSPLSRSGSHERAGGGWTPGGSSVQASPAVQQARGLWQYRQQVVVAVGCAFCQNLTAANSVLYYSTDIFRLAGLNCPFTAGVGVGVMKVVGVIASAWLVEGDTWGRRKLLLVGTFGAFVCHLMFVAAFSMLPEHPKSFERLLSEAAGGAGLSQPRGVILVLVTMYLYMFFWNFSWAGLMFVVASEVLPSGVRGQGMGLVVITYWLVSFIMQLTLESSFEVFTKSGTFALYAFLTLLALLFTYTYIPETKGKSLEEITKFFEKRRKRRLLSLFGKRSSQANTHRRGSPHGLSGHFSSSGGNGEARTVTIEMTPAGPPGSSDDGDIRVHGYGHSTTPVKRPPRDPLADPEQSVSPSRPHAQHMYGYTATAARSGESLEREESGSQVYRPAAAGGAGAGVGSRGRSRTSVEGMEMEAGDRENSTQFDDIDLNGSPRSSFPAAPGSANPNSGQHKFMY